MNPQEQADKEQSQQQAAQQQEQQQGQEEQDVQQQPSEQQNAEEAERKEIRQATEQWLRRIPDDPGGLLREKFRRENLRQRNRDEVENEW